jgi:hypothetical protein
MGIGVGGTAQIGITSHNQMQSRMARARRKEIPDDDPGWYEDWWVDDTYPFDIHSTRHHPDSDEDMGCSGSTCVGRDQQRAEVVSLVRTKEFLESELPLLDDINKRLKYFEENYPEKMI